MFAALHHRSPDLVSLLVRTTRWQLFPHAREGDSSVEAVIHRELVANADAFGLWLSSSLRLTHAVALGRDAVPLR